MLKREFFQPQKNTFLGIEDDLITDFGSMNDLPKIQVDKIIDTKEGKIVLPS